MTPLLKAQDLGKRFDGAPVFASVTFALEAGQHLAVLGPSGCGKSTLLRVLAGLDAPSDGRLWIGGKLASEPGRVVLAPHERGVAMVFQDLALWPTLTALGNVTLGLAAARLGRSERRERAAQMLEWCGLGGLEHRRPAALSIGQQQRVAVARALACHPSLLLLDEPFSSLDWLLKGRLLDELKPLCARVGTTLLLVTHDPAEALALCDHALVLDEGRIVEQGPFSKLLAQPLSRFLKEFIRRSAQTKP
jgi:iron(III) transport system ATP-binding protein